MEGDKTGEKVFEHVIERLQEDIEDVRNLLVRRAFKRTAMTRIAEKLGKLTNISYRGSNSLRKQN